MKVCIDLFSGLGGFSQAFEESEWDVYTVDIEERFDPDLCADIMDVRPGNLLELVGVDRDEIDVLVILASPPCQYLSTAGNHDKWDYNRKVPTEPKSRNAVALFYHALGLVQSLAPDYWYVENPRRSRIRWFIGPPDEWVAYCQYGEDYQKQTGFWGEFAPMTFRKCSGPGKCHNNNTDDDGYQAIQSMPSDSGERAKVPEALSVAIRDAVEEAIENPPPTQSTLGVAGR